MRRLVIRRRRQRAITSDSPRSGFMSPWTSQPPCRTEPQRINDETVVRTRVGTVVGATFAKRFERVPAGLSARCRITDSIP